MTGNKLIALSWLTFAALIVIWGGLWMHVTVPVIAAGAWLVGVSLILRRKKI